MGFTEWAKMLLKSDFKFQLPLTHIYTKLKTLKNLVKLSSNMILFGLTGTKKVVTYTKKLTKIIEYMGWDFLLVEK